MPKCKKCGADHFNFKPCGTAKADQDKRELYTRANLSPEITPPDGWKPWRQEPMTDTRLYGGLEVVKSSLKREGWKER